jgi:hypothetical protein
MPWELSGAHSAEVLCKGRIVRVVVSVDDNSPLALAATIQDYRFVKNGESADA